MLHYAVWIILDFFLRLGDCQSTFIDTRVCVKGSNITAVPMCDQMYSKLLECNSKADTAGCICNQAFLDSCFGCESELRLCFENNSWDSDITNLVTAWHSRCDGTIKFSPTTPPISTLTTTQIYVGEVDYCRMIWSSCNAADQQNNDCGLSYTGKAQTSCMCLPNVLSTVYTCEFLGNTSCLGQPAQLTNMEAYSYCDNFMSVLGAMPSNTPKSTSAYTTSSLSLSSPNLRSSIPGTGLGPTSTSSGSKVAFDNNPECWFRFQNWTWCFGLSKIYVGLSFTLLSWAFA